MMLFQQVYQAWITVIFEILHVFVKYLSRNIALYKYVRKTNSLRGSSFKSLAVIRSISGDFLRFKICVYFPHYC